MAEKKLQIIAPLSPIICYELLLSIGSKINDWKVEKQDKESLSIVFKQGGGIFSISSPVQTSVSILPISDKETQISFLATHRGLVDPFGFLDSALKRLIEPFQIQSNSVTLISTKENLKNSQKSSHINIKLTPEASDFEANKPYEKDKDVVNIVNNGLGGKIEAVKKHVQESIPNNKFPQANSITKSPTISQVVNVHIHPDETETQAATEIVDVPNGVTIKVTRIRTVEHTINIEWSVTLSGKGEVGIKQLVSASIEGEIQRIKGYTIQQTESVGYEVTLNGEKYNRYKLVWMDIWLKGTANIQENTSSYSQPFQFRDRTELKVVPFIDS